MTGPSYPHPNPAPGSNGIGQFQIGISPIGTIPVFDVWTTIIAQYANSPILTSMIESFNAAMDLTVPMENFYDFIWNVDTAQGYGLDVWGRIVGVQRAIQIPGSVSLFGFNEAGASWTGFGQGSFYGGQSINTNYILNDTDFRKLILAKAAGNISDGSIPSVNSILLALFPNRGDCYVKDNQDMSLAYVFLFPLTPVELAIVSQLNVLPNPAGVVINVQQP
jgi:hypothetical protein